MVCWGSGDDHGGAVANAPTDDGLVAVSAGDRFSCALDKFGVAQCWGTDAATTNAPPDPTEVPFTQIASGAVTCAVDRSEKVTCWGQDVFGLLDVPDGFAP